MPKYTFKCVLGHSIQRVVPSSIEGFPCTHGPCSAVMSRQLPTLNGPSTVTEVVNKYTGVEQRRDQKEQVEERKAEYFWTVEVPRFVASGVYSIETMLENGWIWVDDNMQVRVHTKPPHRR